MNNSHSIIIEPHTEGNWVGFVARYVGIPVEVYHEDEIQVLKDLIDAKEEYFATLEKENS